jgi:FtsX-like permease family
MDMVSFRELYGFMSGEKLAEIQALQKEAGAHDVSRENAESELFGKADAAPAPTAAKMEARTPPRHIEATTTPGVSAVTHDLGESLGGKLQREEARSRVFPAGEVEQGVVLNAAVIVKDPKKIKETIAAIEAQGAKDGLTLKAIDWQQAAGLIGQFVYVIRMVLYVAILIIFIIALVIINNALVMATLERVKEIGTLRAIGAQRRFILAMLVVESIVVGVIFGGLGAGLGALIVTLVGKIGVPAKSDIWFFFFSGPRLYPFLGTSNVIAAFVIVLLVSAFSSFYPAWIAMRVTPRQAMAEEE